MKLALVNARQIVRTRRRGSILIFVVALVVLLALVGTAFLSTTGADRANAAQHANNTQIDLITEGVAKAIIARVGAGLYGNDDRLRSVRGGWNGVDAIQTPSRLAGQPVGETPFNTDFISSRIPVKLDPTFPFASNNYLANPAVWRSISAPIFGSNFVTPKLLGLGGTTGLTGYTFTRRDQAIPLSTLNGSDPALGFAGPGGFDRFLAADADGDGLADSGYCQVPVGTLNGVTYFAAYRVVDNNAAINVNTAFSRDKDFLLGGSTDFRQLATLTTSATAGLPTTGLPSRVGLAELFRDANPMATTINQGVSTGMGDDFERAMRFHFSFENTGYTWDNTEFSTQDINTGFNPFSYRWLSMGEMFSQQIARRVENPSLISYRYNGLVGRRFSLSDGLILANGFVVKTNTLDTTLETSLSKTLTASGGTIALSPYAPAGAAAWYRDNFNFFNPTGGADPGELDSDSTTFLNRRALLVTDNPTSVQLPVFSSPVSAVGVPTAILTMFNNVDNTPSSLKHAAAPIGVDDPKIDINQAAFSELWYGFWRLMTDEDIRPVNDRFTNGTAAIADFLPQTIAQAISKADATSPDTAYDSDDLDLPTDPFRGMEFEQGTFLPGTGAGSPPQHPARMFRSVLRDHRPAASARILTLGSMKLLRAGIAASNLESLRAGPRQLLPIPQRRWPTATGNQLEERTRSATFQPQIYGYQPQPFISEIYVNTDVTTVPAGAQANTIGYIAIELYNPYDAPIDTANLVFFAVNRGPSGLIEYKQPLTTTPTPLLFSTLVTAMSGNPFGDATTIPAKGYLVIQNVALDSTGNPMSQKNRPAATRLKVSQDIPASAQGASPIVNYSYMPNLDQLLNHEVILARAPATITGGMTVVAFPPQKYSYPALNTLPGAPTLANTMPLDAYDFTGITPGVAGTAEFTWSYQRGSGTNAEGGRWGCVYPGRYNGGGTPSTLAPRQQGTFAQQITVAGDPWAGTFGPPLYPITLSATSTAPARSQASRATYPSNFQVQLGLYEWPSSTFADNSRFPDNRLRAFTRIGDLLQVPYAGSYVLTTGSTGTDVAEVMPITMDLAFCEDTDPRNDAPSLLVAPVNPTGSAGDINTQVYEVPGRFAPVVRFPANALPAVNAPVLDATDVVFNDVAVDRGSYDDMPTVGTSDPNRQPYAIYRNRWSRRLFDYFATTTPASDMSPVMYYRGDGTANSDKNQRKLWSVRNAAAPADNANLVDDVSGTSDLDIPAIRTEDNVGVHGLINLNTADAKVLSMLPWLPSVTAQTPDLMSFSEAAATRGQIVPVANNVPDSVDLARAIVYWRDFKKDNLSPGELDPGGPFLTPFDLYRIPAFRMAQAIVLQARDPSIPDGDASPITGVPDGTRLDFEEQYLLLNRVSNHVTVRSDSFTVYMVVQGWRNAYSPSAELVTQRRQVFTIDRSSVSRQNSKPSKNLAPSQ